MDSVIKRVIDRCFEDGDILKNVAWNVLQDIQRCEEPVKSLQAMALKTLMAREIKNDIKAEILFSLVFKEPINPWQFMDYNYCSIDDERQKICHELRKDPDFMLAMLDQNMNRQVNSISVKVRRHDLRIKLQSFLVAEIRHPDDKEFDFFWADKFARMALKNNIWSVSLQMDGEGKYDMEYMKSFMNPLISGIKPQVPEEGFKAAFGEGKRKMYMKYSNTVYNGVLYSQSFVLEDKFVPLWEKNYWGFLE